MHLAAASAASLCCCCALGRVVSTVFQDCRKPYLGSGFKPTELCGCSCICSTGCACLSCRERYSLNSTLVPAERQHESCPQSPTLVLKRSVRLLHCVSGRGGEGSLRTPSCAWAVVGCCDTGVKQRLRACVRCSLLRLWNTWSGVHLLCVCV